MTGFSRVGSSSMAPTLHRGDRVAANRAAYLFGAKPRAGEVASYRTPGREHYIHRIVGGPGETLEMRDNVLFRNGKRLEEPYIMLTPDVAAVRSFGPVTVPAGHYFFLGDNRDNANDSRFRDSSPKATSAGEWGAFSTSESAVVRKNERCALWAQIRAQVQQLVDQSIADNNLQQLEDKLHGIQDAMTLCASYTNASEIQQTLNSLDTTMTEAIPQFLTGDPSSNFSCAWGMAMLHISVRKAKAAIYGQGGLSLFSYHKRYTDDRWDAALLDKATKYCNERIHAKLAGYSSESLTNLTNSLQTLAFDSIQSLEAAYPPTSVHGFAQLQSNMQSDELTTFQSSYYPISSPYHQPQGVQAKTLQDLYTVQLDPF